MSLDFSKLENESVADTVMEPRRIFTALPAKDPKYSYPRDVQSQVWTRWHARRAERDLVIKMNTGGGKTVVGLIALKSCLNENVAPAVYVTPDNYLAEQVCREAKALGIATTRDPESRAALTGKAIVVVNVHKLFNGKSVFGVKGAAFRRPAELGAILIDDAHACMATIAEQFTLKIPSSVDAHHKLIELFGDDLVAQSPPTYRDIVEEDRTAVMAVPPWAWADKQKEVLDILHPLREEDGFKFVWPLIVDSLPLCSVAVTSGVVQISPPCPPVHMVPSFSLAQRRLYLTATLADDSVLVTQFDADPDSIRRPVIPDSADDLGDRMILTPEDTFPDTGEDEIRTFVADQANRHNVVVIVPSWSRAKVWEELAVGAYGAPDLDDVLARLRAEHVGLVVLVNKYDGIDLPGNACRVLVLDGLPEAREPLERLESDALDRSDVTLARQLQRIEQGMGRGVRANDDYCVVLLLGAQLTARLHLPKARALLSPATEAQLDLSDRVATMLEGKPFSALQDAVNQCLGREQAWVTQSRNALDGLKYEDEQEVSPIALAERAAFDLAGRGLFADAANTLRKVFAEVTDAQERGLLKQQAAAYLHRADPVAAQQLQLSAVHDNAAALRPVEGVTYKKLTPAKEQARAAATFLESTYPNAAQLVLGVKAMLADLEPSDDESTVKPFEQAVANVGRHLGFATQRPEQEIGNGPDGLWALGQLRFLVIEAKSAATAATIPRKDIEQLGHSLDWFADNYDGTVDVTGVMIHPTRQLDSRATARDGARIMTFDKLADFRDAVMNFARAVGADNDYGDPDAVGDRLAAFRLTASLFVGHWTVAPKSARR